eukprot:571156-Pleurochrysis_carterae.AAC.1
MDKRPWWACTCVAWTMTASHAASSPARPKQSGFFATQMPVNFKMRVSRVKQRPTSQRSTRARFAPLLC